MNYERKIVAILLCVCMAAIVVSIILFGAGGLLVPCTIAAAAFCSAGLALFMTILKEEKVRLARKEEQERKVPVRIRRMDVADPDDEDALGCKRVALLVDADNIESWYINSILKNIGLIEDSVIVYSSLYGNKPAQRTWKDVAEEYGFRQVFSEEFVIGKSSTDFRMVIDCMDLLYQGNIDMFVICSSDSDFTSIAQRITQEDKTVIGMGRRMAPQIYRDACTRFVDLTETMWRSDVSDMILSMVREGGGKADCGEAALKIREAYDYRRFGFESFGQMVKDLGFYVDGQCITLDGVAGDDTERKHKRKSSKPVEPWRIDARRVVESVIDENGGQACVSYVNQGLYEAGCHYRPLGFADCEAMVKSLGYRVFRKDGVAKVARK